MRTGDYRLAASQLEKCLALAQQTGNPAQLAFAFSGLGEVAVRQGHYERAIAWLEQGLTLNRARGDKWGIGTLLGSLGWAALRQRDLTRANELLGESLRIRLETGDKGGMAWCLEKLAEAAHLQGRSETAVMIFGAAAALRTPLGSVIDSADRSDYERLIAELRSTLGDNAFGMNWNKGEALPLNAAIDAALAAALAGPDELIKPLVRRDKEKYRGLTGGVSGKWLPSSHRAKPIARLPQRWSWNSRPSKPISRASSTSWALTIAFKSRPGRSTKDWHSRQRPTFD